jgi:hypothetical protein
MESAIRITGARLIVSLILGVLLATILLRAAMPGPNVVITNRSSFQSLLLMPEELRKSPVEQHLARGDWFIYRLWGTRYGRFLASVLRKIGLPIDAVTQVS